MQESNEYSVCDPPNMIIPHLSRDSKSPKTQVDEASLQQTMERNKESLKLKLMSRRPINQLVDQGIIPSPKVPPLFYEQRQKLERAKMGDFLKHKIQKRPDRQELIQQHILEDTKIDPSLQDKQRQLKKARLADDLNDRLSHRPGPLELVKGNILVADEKFAQAVKEGQIPFKKTCEGQAVRHPPPSFALEEDSGSDVALSPPQDILDHSLSGLSSMDSIALSPYNNQESPTSSLGELRITTSTPLSPLSSHSGASIQNDPVQKEAPSSTGRIRKKSKPKSSQPKTRTIKFHEYKGPPSAQKNQAFQPQAETSYELLLKQQQLFLQWHLEWQQKYPQMILPVTHQPSVEKSKSNSPVGQNADQAQEKRHIPSPQMMISKFEDLKVNDLKAELKKRNLPVSGSKPQLIERLKYHLDINNASNKPEKPSTADSTPVPINVSGIILDTLPALVTSPKPLTSVVTVEANQLIMPINNAVPVQGSSMTSRPSSVAPMDVEMNSNSDAMDCSENDANENIVRLQQKKIMELQRELQRSKMQLQQQQWLQKQQVKQQAQQQVLLAAQPVPIATALPLTTLPQTATMDDKALQKLQQHLQQRFQQQQLLQQLQQRAANGGKQAPGSPAMSAAVKANLAAFIHNQHASVQFTSAMTPVLQPSAPSYTSFKNIVLCPTPSLQAVMEKPRANSLPNGLTQQKLVWASSVPNFSNILPANPGPVEILPKKTPPDYNEATKQLSKSKERSSRKKSVKSPAVDEVLEILIKNGELPPSAAQEPPTPETPKACNVAPVFPNVSNLGATSSVQRPSAKAEQKAPSSQEHNPSLDFDPTLLMELQNDESMDLGMLDPSYCSAQTPFADLSQQTLQTSSNSVMDVELPDWLEVVTNNNPVVSSTSQSRGVNSNCDPLLPNMGSNQEILDMFSLDDLDFKVPSDSNLLSWDKVDFAA